MNDNIQTAEILAFTSRVAVAAAMPEARAPIQECDEEEEEEQDDITTVILDEIDEIHRRIAAVENLMSRYAPNLFEGSKHDSRGDLIWPMTAEDEDDYGD